MASSNRSSDKGGNQGGSTRGQGSGDSTGRGFATMDKDKQREIASEGGRAAHESGNAHEFTPQEARDAGREGGRDSGGNQGQRGNKSNSKG